MRWDLIELKRCSFKIFLENKYYIIDHVGTLLMAPGLARDMMSIWKPACGPHLLDVLIKLHIVTAIYLFVMRGNIVLCHGKVTRLTQR